VTDPPAGVVTFLFTDIEGSTALWDNFPDTMGEALAEHDALIRRVVANHGGYIFTTAGDSFSVSFASPVEALEAAIEIQLALRQPVCGLELRVRMGLHTAEASIRDGDYFGAPLNRCSRIASAAHGGQILLAGSTADRVAAALPERVALTDLGVHRFKGLAEPERIHQVCHEDLRSTFPRLRSLEGPGDQLPGQLTTFVGREAEIADVVSLLVDHRLVTLTGAGGSGKTRLALRVAEELVDSFSDGLRFAELAALFDREVFVDEVAQRFGVVTEVDVPTLVSIAETIADRRMLLVLDNCEQIVEHVAAASRDLLLACPNLRILATSRERLGISGEVVYRVPTLRLPEPGADTATAGAFDSVRLFVDRAALVDPAFELAPDNVADVVAICRRLDGIPLAIELAAARLRAMSPAQVAARLDERFRLLTVADRGGSDRQRTLLQTIEWSHDLLGERERTVFRRLAVFAADFSLEACEMVVSGGDIDQLDVLDLVTGLVDKSMVTTDTVDGTTRYRLLESIREFAAKKLDEADEHAEAARRHAGYFAQYAESLQVVYRKGDLAGALVLLDRDEDNFRSALHGTIGGTDTVLAARMISALGYLWYASGTAREGIQWCRDLFELEPDLPDLVRAGALHSHALMLATMGDPQGGIDALDEEVTLRRRLGDPTRLGAALNNLGNVLIDVGDHDRAEQVLDEAIGCYREAGENPSLILSTSANRSIHVGEYHQAEARFREALEEARSFDDPYSIAVAMDGLGQALVLGGHADQALMPLVEARERFEELNVAPGIANADLFLALVHRSLGARRDAARRLRDALAAEGGSWYEQADYWIGQVAASIIDDAATAAVLVGAAAEHYERQRIPQPSWVVRDLEQVSSELEERLGGEEFGRCFRAGRRRSRLEVAAAATDALDAVIAAGAPSVQP
jgi:predicted ATPase/class 3 adenylate cyclase